MRFNILIIINLIFSLSAITLPVWYQAPRFWGEPRLIKDHLHWVELFPRVGTRRYGYDCRGCQTDINNLIPGTELITDFDLEMQYTQNLRKGFFYQIVAPVRVVESNTIKHLTHGRLGDTLVTAGWGLNYQKFEKLDFLDLTLQVGLVVPSGTKCFADPNCLATGYNGKLGFLANGQLSIGLLDWLTFGGHAAIFNFKDWGEPFNVTSYGIFAKADHLVNGLSMIFAGVRNQETRNNQTQWLFNATNIFIEYDFSCLHHPYRPTFGLIFDVARSGKCIIPITMHGFYFSIVY